MIFANRRLVPAMPGWDGMGSRPMCVFFPGRYSLCTVVLTDAGGMSLIPMMKLRMAQPGHLVDLRAIESLRGVCVEGQHPSRVGNLSNHRERMPEDHGATRHPDHLPVPAVAERLREATATRHHRFWPDTTSLLSPGVADWRHAIGPKQITDAYLLALAVERQGRFATFDTRVALSTVTGADRRHICVI